MARPSPDVAPMTTATRPLRSNRFGMLIRNLHATVVLRIGPPVVGNNRRPSRTSRILIVRIVSQALVKLVVLAEFLAIELHAEPGPSGHIDRPVLVLHEAALNHIVCQMMIVRVGRERKIRNRRTQM